MGVDIIIPIYNAFDDLQICLESIYRYTDLKTNRLVLINDNSSDDRIRSFLDQQIKENVIVIHNEINKGFSENVNAGIAQSSERDVILLNSDTIVTSKWVEKMIDCAYSDISIGTVTPVSNNATICSVPDFCAENVLPQGMTVDRAAMIVEMCSMKRYPRITVAVGFCMLVKREVINIVGYFDAKTFGRGYGEENDFCNRAEQLGYIHVMCDDTYIFHSGTKSFVSKEKELYMREHEKILYERYPAQMRKNAIYCQDNPNAFVGRNIGYHFDIINGRKNILYLLQADFRDGASDNLGGIQLHVKHLTQGMRQYVNVFVLARDMQYLQVTAYVQKAEHTFRFYIGEQETPTLLHNREFANVFSQILVGFHIDLVHVHHTASTSLDIYYEADKLGIPVVFTAHDFYYVCPTIKLLNQKGNVCIGCAEDECAECLRLQHGLYNKNDYITYWRRKHAEVLKLCRSIVVPSQSTEDIMEKYFPEQKEKIRVIEHGMDNPKLLAIAEEDVIYTDDLVWTVAPVTTKSKCPVLMGTAYFKGEETVSYRVVLKVVDDNQEPFFFPTNFQRDFNNVSEGKFYAFLSGGILADGRLKVSVFLEKEGKYYAKRDKEEILPAISFDRKSRFNVAFIGGLNEEKGSRIITEIIRKGLTGVDWYVMGGIGDPELANLQKNNLIKMGFYHQKDLYTHLQYHQIDAICILSKCPETFSYTLSEAIVSNIPVIVTDVGALGQRVKDNKCGAIVSSDKNKATVEVIDCIKEWMNHAEIYNTVKMKVQYFKHDDLAQMIQQYYALYNEIYSKAAEDNDKLRKPSVDTLKKLYDAYLLGMHLNEDENMMQIKISALENRLKVIDNSVTFKIVLWLTKIRIPYKDKLRKLLVKSKGK